MTNLNRTLIRPVFDARRESHKFFPNSVPYNFIYVEYRVFMFSYLLMRASSS